MICGRILAVTGIISVAAVSVRGDDNGVGRVSRTPPPVFSQRIEPLLTPLEAARQLPRSSAMRTKGPLVEILLRETVVHVEEDGRETTASHDISTMLNKEAADRYREASNLHTPGLERIHLVMARTVREDDTKVPVEESAVFIKRPESETDVHSDTEDLHLVFPDVTPGSTLERIVVRETLQPVMPGEFLLQQIWAGVGPARRIRLVVDLPESMLPRLRSQGLGFKLPAPTRESAGPGRVRLTWQSDAVAPSDYEAGGPPSSQAGPALRLSTLPGWDAIGNWYAGLVKDRSEVTSELKEAAARWSDGAGTPREIAAALCRHVSDDVRYTGLEFGRGSHQPRAPAEVLTTRYGDCKDKANLLRLLLRERGIASRIVLLDTRHSGAIDKELPSFGRFDHAILAVDFAGATEPVFCDPTIEQADFGTLSPSDVGRDALLIGEDGSAKWTTTPAQKMGRYETIVDLNLEPGGGLSGWATLRTQGFFAARLRQSVEKAERSTALKSLEQNWLPVLRATVVDYEVASATGTAQAGTCEVRAYVVRTGAVVESKGGNERVTFPLAGLVVPRLGEDADRRTSITSMQWQTDISGQFHLPPGWKPLDTPPPFTRDLEGWKFTASWKAKGRTLSCRASSEMTAALIHPAAHRTLWQSRQDLFEWLASPALLKRAAPPKSKAGDDDDDATTRPWTPPPDSLPKMPSAEGQLVLLDKRFPLDPNNPFDGDHDGRRTAARKLIEYFPESHLANFEGGMRMVVADIFEGEFEEAYSQVQKLIAEHGPHVDSQRVISAQMLLASTLAGMDNRDEALPLAQAVAENPQALPMVRQGAAFIAAACLEKDDPHRSLAFARQAVEGTALPTLAVVPAAVLVMTSLARLPETKADDLIAEWSSILKRHAAHDPALREEIVIAPDSLLDSAHLDSAERLLAALTQHADSGGYADDQKENLEAIGKVLAEARANAPSHDRVRAWLREHPWPDADMVEPDDSVDTFMDCGFALEDRADDFPIAFRYALRRLTHYGPQPDFAGHAEEAAEIAEDWLAAAASKDAPETPPPPPALESALDMLVQAWADTPEDEFAPHRAANFRGKVIKRREGAAAALAHYHALSADTNAPDFARVEAHQDASWILQELRDYPAVLAEWRALEAWPGRDGTDAYRVRAAYLALAIRQREEAWRCFELTAQADPKNFRYMLPKGLHSDIQSMLKDRKSAEAWWQQSDAWWPQWEALAKAAGIPAPDDVLTSTPRGEFKNIVADAEKLYLETEGTGPSADSERLYYGGRMYETMLTARWHRAYAAHSVKLLREHIAERFPGQAEVARELATRIESEAKEE